MPVCMPTELGMWKLPGLWAGSRCGEHRTVLDGAAGGDPQHRDLYGARPLSKFHRFAVHDNVGATNDVDLFRRKGRLHTALFCFLITERDGQGTHNGDLDEVMSKTPLGEKKVHLTSTICITSKLKSACYTRVDSSMNCSSGPAMWCPQRSLREKSAQRVFGCLSPNSKPG